MSPRCSSASRSSLGHAVSCVGPAFGGDGLAVSFVAPAPAPAVSNVAAVPVDGLGSAVSNVALAPVVFNGRAVSYAALALVDGFFSI